MVCDSLLGSSCSSPTLWSAGKKWRTIDSWRLIVISGHYFFKSHLLRFEGTQTCIDLSRCSEIVTTSKVARLETRKMLVWCRPMQCLFLLTKLRVWRDNTETLGSKKVEWVEIERIRQQSHLGLTTPIVCTEYITVPKNSAKPFIGSGAIQCLFSNDGMPSLKMK